MYGFLDQPSWLAPSSYFSHQSIVNLTLPGCRQCKQGCGPDPEARRAGIRSALPLQGGTKSYVARFRLPAVEGSGPVKNPDHQFKSGRRLQHPSDPVRRRVRPEGSQGISTPDPVPSDSGLDETRTTTP